MECIVRVLITEAIILDFMLIFQKRHFTEKNLDIGTERLKLPETCLTTQNYYRRNQMSKGKDISTMFTKEENKKNGRLGYGLATREKDTIISLSQYGAFLQKRGKRR